MKDGKGKRFDRIMSGMFSSSFQAGCQKSPCDYYKRLFLKLLSAENLNKFSFKFVESKELETVTLARRLVPRSSECSQLLVFQTGALSTLGVSILQRKVWGGVRGVPLFCKVEAEIVKGQVEKGDWPEEFLT